MTTTVQVSVPAHANYKARVENHDRNDNGETQKSLGGIVLPGETATHCIHSHRDILVSEIALSNNEGTETSEIDA